MFYSWCKNPCLFYRFYTLFFFYIKTVFYKSLIHLVILLSRPVGLPPFILPFSNNCIWHFNKHVFKASGIIETKRKQPIETKLLETKNSHQSSQINITSFKPVIGSRSVLSFILPFSETTL